MAKLEIFEIGLQTYAHLHIAHSSLARGFALAEMFRGMDIQVSDEACIQYLCMTEDDLVRLGGCGKCIPPFRTAAEVELMWAALTEDRISGVTPTTRSGRWRARRRPTSSPAVRDWWACRVLPLRCSPRSTSMDRRRL
jgi:hypothetical protein